MNLRAWPLLVIAWAVSVAAAVGPFSAAYRIEKLMEITGFAFPSKEAYVRAVGIAEWAGWLWLIALAFLTWRLSTPRHGGVPRRDAIREDGQRHPRA